MLSVALNMVKWWWRFLECHGSVPSAAQKDMACFYFYQQYFCYCQYKHDYSSVPTVSQLRKLAAISLLPTCVKFVAHHEVPMSLLRTLC